MVNTHFQSSKTTTTNTFVLFALLLGFMMLVSFPGPLQASNEGKVKSAPMEEYKEIARTMVHGVAAGLGGVLANVKNEKKRIDLIRSFITPIRFYPDNSGYFYVYDFKCVNIAHATQKDLQGKNLYDHKDVKGKYVIRALSEASKKGGGFVDFYWLKPDSKEEFAKMGYVEPIPGTDYFIGTGVYLP
ncbi:MAG: cache domain-containing protein [Proteobacteria bacterium]|nr:cache domain-containing protein [Pseudomonadota bacterium]